MYAPNPNFRQMALNFSMVLNKDLGGIGADEIVADAIIFDQFLNAKSVESFEAANEYIIRTLGSDSEEFDPAELVRLFFEAEAGAVAPELPTDDRHPQLF